MAAKGCGFKNGWYHKDAQNIRYWHWIDCQTSLVKSQRMGTGRHSMATDPSSSRGGAKQQRATAAKGFQGIFNRSKKR